MNLAHLSELFQLPNYGVLTPVHNAFNQDNFLYTLTCSGRCDKARSTKATWLRSLYRLTANNVFARVDSQNVVRKGELFILRVALHSQPLNIDAFIASHFKEQAQTSKVVIAHRGAYYHHCLGFRFWSQSGQSRSSMHSWAY